jgi:excisionase family DNA binding protein
VTVKDASKRIGISRSELYRLVRDRRIGHFRIGGKIVLSLEDVDAFLKGCHVPANVPLPIQPAPKLKHIKLKHVSPALTNTLGNGRRVHSAAPTS